MSTYAYEPLEAGQIRILELFPGKAIDPLTGCLRTYFLSSGDSGLQLEYEALSYVWGHDPEHHQISLQANLTHGYGLQDGPGAAADGEIAPVQHLAIGRNLSLALHRLRQEKETRHLWCDQICIDQSNVTERSAQVGLMGQIYQKTSCVIVWLGPEADGSAHAITALDQSGSQLITPLPNWNLSMELVPGADPRYLDSGLLPFSLKEWQACGRLVQRQWFKRLWVRQEIALAPQATVVVGSSTMSWSRLINGIACLHSKAAKSRASGEEYPASLSQTLLDALNIGRMRPYQAHFVGWIALTLHCECTDDRDRVYAILNLFASDNLIVQPDYTLGVKDVYKSVVTHFGGLGDLKILQFCDRATSPTWVPDLHDLEHAPGLHISLTSEASASSGAMFNVIDSDKVEVAGVSCGTVSRAGGFDPPAGLSELSDDVIKETTVKLLRSYLGGEHTLWREEILEKFVGAVVGWCAFEQTNTWPNPQVRHVVASLRYWAELWSLVNEPDGTDNIIRLTRFFNRTMHLRGSEADHEMRVVSEFVFLQALRQTFKRMVPAQLQDGSFAIVPADCQSNDRLYVILGCPVVLLLRGDSHSGYRVIGPCAHRDYAWGQAFYGPLPDGWTAVRDIVTGYVAFVNEDGLKQKRHPRAAEKGPVSGWIEVENDGGTRRWRREDDGEASTGSEDDESFTTGIDPQLTPDVLRGWGIHIEDLVLI